MEDWQRRVIQTNLQKLHDNTFCNTALLTSLFQKDLITLEENTEISVIPNRITRAKLLYQILITRVNAYNEFLKTCIEVKQSGVVSILEEGEKTVKLSNGLNECNISEFSCDTRENKALSCFDNISNAISQYVEIETFKFAFESKGSQLENKLWSLRGPNDETFLHVAAAHGYIKLIKYLIKLGLHISTVDNNGRTAGHYIGKSSTNIIQTTETLIEHGLIICHVDNGGFTIACTVAEYGKINQYHYHHWVTYMMQNGYEDAFAQKTGIGTTALHHAVQMLDLEKETIELILKSAKVNINQPDNRLRIPLHWALISGRSLKALENLKDLGANFVMTDEHEQGFLHFAVQGSNKEVITILMSASQEKNIMDRFGETPLHKVKSTKSRDFLEMTIFLLDLGANLYAKNIDGNTLAHLIVHAENITSDEYKIWVKGMIDFGHSNIFAVRGQFEWTPLQAAMQTLDLDLRTMKMVLESSNEDINQPDVNGYTLFFLALEFRRNLQTIENLYQLGVNLEIKDGFGSGALHKAVVGGGKEVVQYLVSKGLDVNEKDNNGDTPLHYVIRTRQKNYFEMTMMLMDIGADLYSKNNRENTLAHELAVMEDVTCNDFKVWVTAMISKGHGNMLTIRGQWGRTPLQCSMERLDLDLETMELIIKTANHDINQPDYNGSTIIHIAIAYGRSLDTIKNLLNLGADWKREGIDGRSVLHSAVLESNEEVFLYFKSLGADVNARDIDGQTPLHYVRWTKSNEYLVMTKLVLDNEADFNAKDNQGKSLFQIISAYITAEDYQVWVQDMIQLGYLRYVEQKSCKLM